MMRGPASSYWSPPTPTECGFARSTIETWRNASVIAISRVGKMDVRENRWIARRGIRLRTTAETRFEREMAFVVELRLAGSTRMSTIASEAAHVGREAGVDATADGGCYCGFAGVTFLGLRFQMVITRSEPALQDLARRRSHHATKRAREVRGIREPGGVRRLRDGLAARELTGAALQT